MRIDFNIIKYDFCRLIIVKNMEDIFMKNSKLLRVLLIALAAIMTFSLFACTETPENSEESQSSSEESTPNTTETDPKEPTEGSEETSDVNSEEKTEETSEETTEGTTVETSEETTEETTTETSEETTEETSEETTTVTSEETTEETTETPACEHIEEIIAGTPATCEDAGLTDGKKCIVCGETIVEQQVIPALGHNFVDTTVATSATCTAEGTMNQECDKEGCEETTTRVIPATGHVDLTEVPENAATCVSKGNDAYYTCACGAIIASDGKTILTAIPEIDLADHVWDNGTETVAPKCGVAGETTYKCTICDEGIKTEPIAALEHVTSWQYVSNEGTKYEGTRYAVEAKICSVCEATLETRAAVIAFNIDSMNLADKTGAAYDPKQVMGSGYGEMVTDPTKRVTPFETIYLRKTDNFFVVATGWVGINGDFDTANGYYRILDENGNPLTEWVTKPIANTTEKPADADSYKSVKGQLAAHGVTDFVARGFKTNNLNTTIDGVDYAKYDKPIAIEYALKAVDAPEGSDLITVIVFKNVYKVCTSHSCSDWQYVSGVGTEWEGTGYAVQGGTCDNCGEYVTRAAVIAFNFDSVAAADSTGANFGITGIGTGGGDMVTDPDARVTTQDKIYLRSNQFLMAQGWIGVAGEMDINNAYYRILNNETGEVILDWQTKVISDTSSSSVRPQVKPENAGSYTSVKTQLSKQGITDFTAYGFRTNNLTVTEYASTTTPIAIEYAVKIVGAPEGYDLIRVIIFKNVYKAS